MRSNFRRATLPVFPNVHGHAMSAHRNSVPITHNAIELLVMEVSAIRGVEQSAIKLLDLLGARLRAAIKTGSMNAVSAVASELGNSSAVLTAALFENQ